ncbi:ATP-grasp domain-containing protein [Flavobacteriaceae bacterium]|nr:ATP-grasp domain-containing protein [Flavobacteriaceae bacterium]
MVKKILIIGAGWEQASLIETAKNLGHYIIATHPDITAEGFKLANQYYVKDSIDIQGHIEIAKTYNIDAILTDNCDYSLYTASIIASKLKLPCVSIESAILSNDKFSQRDCVKHIGVKQPNFYKIKNLNDLNKVSSSISFPSIIKPVDSRGNFGVTIIESNEMLEEAFYHAINNSPSRTLIYEEFINGTLITVDGFCFKNGHQSLAVASRKFDKGIKPITKEIIYPSKFSENVNKLLLDYHNNVVKALNYTFGHTHGEYILTENDDIYLVECTNRGGGVYTSSVILPLLTKYPINECLINQALGIDKFEPPNKGLESMTCSVMLTFLDYEIGKVIDEINIDEVCKLPFIVRFKSKYKTNDMVETIENGAGRHSMLVIKGDSNEATFNNLKEFKQNFVITYHK